MIEIFNFFTTPLGILLSFIIIFILAGLSDLADRFDLGGLIALIDLVILIFFMSTWIVALDRFITKNEEIEKQARLEKFQGVIEEVIQDENRITAFFDDTIDKNFYFAIVSFRGCKASFKISSGTYTTLKEKLNTEDKIRVTVTQDMPTGKIKYIDDAKVSYSINLTANNDSNHFMTEIVNAYKENVNGTTTYYLSFIDEDGKELSSQVSGYLWNSVWFNETLYVEKKIKGKNISYYINDYRLYSIS